MLKIKSTRAKACALLLLLCLFAVWPTRSLAAEAPRLIGILAVPSIFTYTTEVTENPTLPIYEAPNVAAPVIAIASKLMVTSSAATDIYLPEVGYEENGFDVLAKQDGWYQVLLRRTGGEDGLVPPPLTGWVLPPDDAIFTPLDDYLAGALLEFTTAWDGQLFSTAGGTTPAGLRPAAEETEPVNGADIHNTKLIDDTLWVHVNLHRLCDADDSVYGTGWVPLPTDWRTLLVNYPRGC